MLQCSLLQLTCGDQALSVKISYATQASSSSHSALTFQIYPLVPSSGTISLPSLFCLGVLLLTLWTI